MSYNILFSFISDIFMKFNQSFYGYWKLLSPQIRKYQTLNFKTTPEPLKLNLKSPQKPNWILNLWFVPKNQTLNTLDFQKTNPNQV